MKFSKKFKSLTCLFIASCLVTAGSYAQQHKLSDPEIASIAVTANQIDIDAGKLAKTKTSNKEVINFANTMINDHKAVIGQAVALVTKLKVTPKDNDVSKKLLADAAKTKKTLQAKSGKAFDKAYIDNEVAYHKAVISTVETMLIPQTQNQELKQLLQNVLPPLRAHLGHAEMLQKNYK
jgi:putative membrane protein